ncbi:MAG: hypothetical protein WEA24_06550 [Gemmatimonadota bacterium]
MNVSFKRRPPAAILAYRALFAGVIVTVALPLAGCRVTSPSIDAEERAIWTAAVLHAYSGDEAWAGSVDPRPEEPPAIGVIVVDVPRYDAPGSVSPEEREARLLRRWSDVRPDAVRDFLRRNAEPFTVPPLDGIDSMVAPTHDDLRALMDNGGWAAFYERYPTAPGIIRLSRPGISRDGSSAVLEVMTGRGELWAQSGPMFLRRVDGRWVVDRWRIDTVS